MNQPSGRPSIAGAIAKLERADKHLRIAARLGRRFMKRECRIESKLNPHTNLTELVAVLPAPPPLISLVMGDCVHNMRAALDHLAWSIILSNTDRPQNTPNSLTMYPICETAEGFRDRLKRGRLRGVPEGALEVIDRMQPYHRLHPKRHPLWLLDKLENIDKHRRLTLTAAVGVDGLTEISFDNGQRFAVPHGRFHDGAVLLAHGVPTTDTGGMNVDGVASFAIFVRETELFPVEFDGIDLLVQIQNWIRGRLIPQLRPFIGVRPS